MSANFSVTLTPNDWDLRTRALTLGEREWALAVKLVDRTGFRPNLVGGVDRRDVGSFARHLARALEQEGVSDSDRRALGDLHRFLTHDAGNRGLALSRGWKRWDKV